MGTLLDSIASLAARARKYKDRGLGEQNTKASLVEPVLEALGWDIRDPDEVHREFRPTGKDSPVDYALKLMRKPRLFVEAKGLGETLSDRRWIAQVLGYATVAGVEWCVLTDGNEFRFFNASAPIDAEEKMFCRIRLTETPVPDSAKALSLLSRSNLEQNLLDALWISHFVDRRVKVALRDMLAAPSKSIVKLVRDQVPKLTPKEVAESLRRLDIRIESAAIVLPEVPKRGSRPGKPAAKSARPLGAGAGGAQVSLADLIGSGHIKPPLRLFCHYKGRDLEATVLADGRVEVQGERHASCSTAAAFARATVTGRNMSTNGWDFWKYEGADGKAHRLDELRRPRDAARSKAPGDRATLRLAGG